ncbi:MAG TPA: hypothetical protein VH988_35040 [Thermoanaerobaculia bacterium]|jgi:hypothetical protein|nr:hypothetical protein [Thermoanaerobaculia bacterium]
MSSDVSGDPVLLRSYLLGELADADADALEISLLQDDALFELAEAVEGDLLAALARGGLAAGDRQNVLHRLAASPGGRARLALAEGLTSLTGSAPGMQAPLKAPLPFRRPVPRVERPVYRFAAMAAGVLVTAGGVWLALQTAHPGGMTARATRNKATAAVQNAAATPPPRKAMPAPTAGPSPARAPLAPKTSIAARPQAQPAPHRPPLAAVVFELALSTTRSAEQHHSVLTIPAGTQRVEIQLPLDDGLGEPFKTYRAAVLDATSEAEIWSQEGLAPRAGKDGPMVVLSLPAAKLPEGLYKLDLRGHGEDGALELVGLPSFEVRLISSHR